METDDFENQTAAFLSWLSGIGVKISPKAQLVDLRLDGRGRGVGVSPFPFPMLPLLSLSLYTGFLFPVEQWKTLFLQTIEIMN